MVATSHWGLPVATAEFEEKEYETAAVIELASGKLGRVYSAGQVMERLLGYDAVASPPDGHAIWRVLALPRPAGLRLLPQHWGSGERPDRSRLPTLPISLILQFKRPEYLAGARAKQWRYWNRPYFRFERAVHQQAVLKRLELATGSDVVVRYACPAFWRRGSLEAAHERRTVIEESGFVSPRVLGNHRVWTYVTAGGVGKGNPSGKQVRGESRQDLQRLLSATLEQALRPSGLPALPDSATREHIIGLGAAAEARTPSLRARLDRWERALLDAEVGLTDQEVRAVRALAAVTTVVSELGAIWFLLDQVG